MITTHMLAAVMVLGTAGVPLVAQHGAAGTTRPAWVGDGMPDAVWTLVEAAVAEENKGRTKDLLKQAEVQARTAVAGHEGDVRRQFGLAVVLGLRAEHEGGKTKIAAASELHKVLGATLELEPTHARARHMMGRLSAAVLRMSRVTRWLATSVLGGGELKKATWAEAERDLAFAEAQAPEVSDHHMQLANLYRDTRRPELALVEVEHVLAIRFHSAMERAVHNDALKLQKKLR